MPGRWWIAAATSSASAMLGTRLGLTYETQAMCLSPVSASASMRRTFSATGIIFFSDWKPSRGPSSLMVTRLGRSDMTRTPGRSALFLLERFLAGPLDVGQRHQDQQNGGDDQEAEADRPRDEHRRVATRKQHGTPEIFLHL